MKISFTSNNTKINETKSRKFNMELTEEEISIIVKTISALIGIIVPLAEVVTNWIGLLLK